VCCPLVQPDIDRFSRRPTRCRAVLFAGGTVVIALLGLFVVGLPFMDGLAAATIVAVALALVGALTLLPPTRSSRSARRRARW
jgi:uncharacterized membrane protein YdfJ with MMPL/SSD domain